MHINISHSQTRVAAMILFAAIVLSACTTPSTSSRKEWTRDDVIGLSIELVDPVDVQQMSFTGDGRVALSFGKRDGPVAGPVFTWRLGSGRLQILDYEGKIYEELTLISQDASTIVARGRSGQTATYRIRERRAA